MFFLCISMRALHRRRAHRVAPSALHADDQGRKRETVTSASSGASFDSWRGGLAKKGRYTDHGDVDSRYLRGGYRGEQGLEETAWQRSLLQRLAEMATAEIAATKNWRSRVGEIVAKQAGRNSEADIMAKQTWKRSQRSRDRGNEDLAEQLGRYRGKFVSKKRRGRDRGKADLEQQRGRDCGKTNSQKRGDRDRGKASSKTSTRGGRDDTT